MFPKSFFSLNGGQALCACACPDGHAPPFKWRKAFWKHVECENSFCKKSRNLSWVEAGFSFQWLNFSKNAWNFALFKIWSVCRCDMKIIFGVFDNVDAKLLSNKIFCHLWKLKNRDFIFLKTLESEEIRILFFCKSWKLKNKVFIFLQNIES